MNQECLSQVGKYISNLLTHLHNYLADYIFVCPTACKGLQSRKGESDIVITTRDNLSRYRRGGMHKQCTSIVFLTWHNQPQQTPQCGLLLICVPRVVMADDCNAIDLSVSLAHFPENCQSYSYATWCIASQGQSDHKTLERLARAPSSEMSETERAAIAYVN